ncbi:hypothetical protein BS329_41085 [Amycolatopsis coloradensis]|uniref:HTH araC/xylS-type domain-containing protein n=1 Tax=Amycolatopsis coloradensis TaxID=76021 RepID=A0A1R0KDA4_9PSEU|nr:hypothetical protein BS329_41085 [Amycolatopsis coloradensis]
MALLDEPELPKSLDRSWRSLTTSGGAVRVDDIAERAGLSRQHLATRFRRSSPRSMSDSAL